MPPLNYDVRFTPESGLRADIAPCPKSAKTGLGRRFTAHITGNLVVASALVVRGGLVNLAQLLAIPVFIIALALVWLIADLSTRK